MFPQSTFHTKSQKWWFWINRVVKMISYKFSLSKYLLHVCKSTHHNRLNRTLFYWKIIMITRILNNFWKHHQLIAFLNDSLRHVSVAVNLHYIYPKWDIRTSSIRILQPLIHAYSVAVMNTLSITIKASCNLILPLTSLVSL